MESTHPRLTKLVPFTQRMCEDLYSQHPAVYYHSVYEAHMWHQESHFAITCLVCEKTWVLNEKEFREYINKYRENSDAYLLKKKEEIQRKEKEEEDKDELGI